MIREALTTALPVLRALGEETRVQIVGVFLERGGAATVGEVQSALGLPQSTVSRHLRILLDARLLAVTRAGAQRVYRLAVPADALDALDTLVGEVRRCQAEPHG
ncbi:metalloregulator ArsR/SmtB family transcription factor [Amycolatopsis sp. OK19-0408]|uniref:Metalloregulator ArsR/SmtB family transcription factor n=1 Tax=Amycolatopsis iheyensis TaxID=2945988 RepID=A0A9X2N3H3_9PSEU|nr:metalloregulator ArsR/SmtB family transcription factor [Amycolatopsis iheyensis]MCR6481591.1 metalloregulator ArsR/SmtB family transcription factor [Amycolatopsis iheyensis]